jgi:hypothetical protein
MFKCPVIEFYGLSENIRANVWKFFNILEKKGINIYINKYTEEEFLSKQTSIPTEEEFLSKQTSIPTEVKKFLSDKFLTEKQLALELELTEIYKEKYLKDNQIN